MLTKVEVWWYLVVQLGPNLSPYFDQVRDKSFFLNSFSFLQWFEIYMQGLFAHEIVNVTKQMRHFLFNDKLMFISKVFKWAHTVRVLQPYIITLHYVLKYKIQ